MAHTDELRWWTVTTKKTGRCLGGCRLKRSSEKVAKKLRAKCRSSVGGGHSGLRRHWANSVPKRI